MNNFRRNQFLLTIFILLLVLFLIWLWRFLPFAEIAKLWGQPDINKILLGIIPTAIIGTFIIFRNAIVTVIKKLVSPGGTEADRQRWEKEQKYLQNFIIAYRDNVEPNSPWEVTKYTDLEALHKDQDKRAHIVQPRLRPILGAEDVHVEENLGARVNIQTFLRHERRPIMIKGEPGTGKTLTIRRFAFDQAEEAKNSASGKIKLPIYIPLSRYIGRTSDGKEPEPVIDFIKKYLQEKVPTASVIYDDLQTYLVDGRLLLLFDGLNELLPDEYLDRSKKLEEFIALYPSNKAIFTCRTPRYTKEDNFITVELSDLSNEQIERFIAAYKGEKVAKALYQELATGDDFMLRVFRNPFMLRMLVKRNSDKAPDTPAQLFEEYVQDQLISQGWVPKKHLMFCAIWLLLCRKAVNSLVPWLTIGSKLNCQACY